MGTHRSALIVKDLLNELKRRLGALAAGGACTCLCVCMCVLGDVSHLLLLARLIHLGLQEVDEFGLLGYGALHFYLLMRVNSLQID